MMRFFRYHKYKDVFAMRSSDTYQPQWIMSGLGMYISVVMYPEGEDTALFVKQDEKVILSPGLDAINTFFDKVENFTSQEGHTFSDLCAKHTQIPLGDKCYRMNMSQVTNPEYKKGSGNLYKMMTKERVAKFKLTFPSQKVPVLA